MFGVIAAANRRFKIENNFVTIWKTTEPNESIVIPLNSDNHDIVVNWGDGTTNSYTGIGTDLDVSHVYVAAGEYSVTITGLFKGVNMSNSDQTNRNKLIELTRWGKSQWSSLTNAFRGCSNLIITAEDIPNLSNVRQATSTFRDCLSLTNIPNINQWNVSHFDAFVYTFAGTPIDVSFEGWDISNVKNMGGFLNWAELSVENYSKTLIAWAGLQLRPNVGASFGYCKYNAEAAIARQYIIDTFGWTISDGGPV